VRRPYTKEEIDHLFGVFGINLEERLKDAGSEQEALERFEACRDDAHRKFKRLALDCHPDRHPEKGEEFKELSMAWNAIEVLKLRIGPPPQMMRPVRVHVHFGGFNPFGGFGSASTVNTSTGTSTSWADMSSGWRTVKW